MSKICFLLPGNKVDGRCSYMKLITIRRTNNFDPGVNCPFCKIHIYRPEICFVLSLQMFPRPVASGQCWSEPGGEAEPGSPH